MPSPRVTREMIEDETSHKAQASSVLYTEVIAEDGCLENTHNNQGHSSVVTYNNNQYVAYYNDQSPSEIVLGKRQILPTKGAWTWRTLDGSGGGGDNAKTLAALDDNHDSIAMGFDDAGFLHIAFGMHADALTYFRMPNTESITGDAPANASMVGTNETAVTYPKFFNDTSGVLYFTFRDGTSLNGDIYFYKYNSTGATWAAVAGTGAAGKLCNGKGDSDSVYLSIPYVTSSNKMYFVGHWSTAAGTHVDPFLFVYDATNETYTQADGTTQTIPVTQANDSIITTVVSAGNNELTVITPQRNLYVDSNGKIHVVLTVFDSNNIRQAFYYTHPGTSGGSWTTGTAVTNASYNAHADLVGTVSCIMVDPNDGVYYITFWLPSISFSRHVVESRDKGRTWSAPYPIGDPLFERFEFNVDYQLWDADGQFCRMFQFSRDLNNGNPEFVHQAHQKRSVYLQTWKPAGGKVRGHDHNNALMAHDDVIVQSFNGDLHLLSKKNTIQMSGNVEMTCEQETDSNNFQYTRYQDTNANVAPNVILRRARGEVDAPATVQTGDRVGLIQVSGYDGDSFETMLQMLVESSGTIADGQVPCNLTLNMSNASGALLARVIVDNGGRVSLGATAPATSAALDLQKDTHALILNRMTTTNRDAMTPVNGMVIYNSTLNKFQGYENGAWVNLI